MKDAIEVNGIILKTSDVGEYDRRCVILTKESGKVTVFARGAKRMKSPYLAATNPFCYGKFTLFPSKDAYSLAGCEISNYFDELRVDYDKTILGMFFLEVADYYSRENNDDFELMKLLYVSLLSLGKDRFSDKLINAVYIIKAIAVNGEFPGIPKDRQVSNIVTYTINRIVESDVTSLYSFDLSEEYTDELYEMAQFYFKTCMSVKLFKTLEFLK